MEDGQQYSETSPVTKSSSTPLIMALVIILLGSYYYLNQKPSSEMSMPTSSTTPAVVEASPASMPAIAVMEGDTKVFTLEGGSFYYKPNLIEVKKGDKVKVIVNSVSMMHDFVIDELKVKSELAKSGSNTTVEFVADQLGSFEFYCSVGQHRAQGMVGTLIVTD